MMHPSDASSSASSRFSPVDALTRLQSLQGLCARLDLDALLFVGGVDGRDNLGATRAINFLLGGVSGFDLLEREKLVVDWGEDVVLLVRRDGVEIHLSERAYDAALPLIACWGDVVVHTLPPRALAEEGGAEEGGGAMAMAMAMATATAAAEEEEEEDGDDDSEDDDDASDDASESDDDDDDAAQDFKLSALVAMLTGVESVGVALTPGSKHVPPVMETETWPLLQAYGLEGVGRSGFFTINTRVVDVFSELHAGVFAQLDSAALRREATDKVPSLRMHWSALVRGLDDASTSEQRAGRSERVVAEPLTEFFSYGNLRRPIGCRAFEDSQLPRLSFGVRTDAEVVDAAEEGDGRVSDVVARDAGRGGPAGGEGEGEGEGGAKHFVVEACHPKSPGLRCARTYFLASDAVRLAARRGFVPSASLDRVERSDEKKEGGCDRDDDDDDDADRTNADADDADATEAREKREEAAAAARRDAIDARALYAAYAGCVAVSRHVMDACANRWAAPNGDGPETWANSNSNSNSNAAAAAAAASPPYDRARIETAFTTAVSAAVDDDEDVLEEMRDVASYLSLRARDVRVELTSRAPSNEPPSRAIAADGALRPALALAACRVSLRGVRGLGAVVVEDTFVAPSGPGRGGGALVLTESVPLTRAWPGEGAEAEAVEGTRDAMEKIARDALTQFKRATRAKKRARLEAEAAKARAAKEAEDAKEAKEAVEDEDEGAVAAAAGVDDPPDAADDDDDGVFLDSELDVTDDDDDDAEDEEDETTTTREAAALPGRDDRADPSDDVEPLGPVSSRFVLPDALAPGPDLLTPRPIDVVAFPLLLPERERERDDGGRGRGLEDIEDLEDLELARVAVQGTTGVEMTGTWRAFSNGATYAPPRGPPAPLIFGENVAAVDAHGGVGDGDDKTDATEALIVFTFKEKEGGGRRRADPPLCISLARAPIKARRVFLREVVPRCVLYTGPHTTPFAW